MILVLSITKSTGLINFWPQFHVLSWMHHQAAWSCASKRLVTRSGVTGPCRHGRTFLIAALYRPPPSFGTEIMMLIGSWFIFLVRWNTPWDGRPASYGQWGTGRTDWSDRSKGQSLRSTFPGHYTQIHAWDVTRLEQTERNNMLSFSTQLW